jgi:hypothetical protein
MKARRARRWKMASADGRRSPPARLLPGRMAPAAVAGISASVVARP